MRRAAIAVTAVFAVLLIAPAVCRDIPEPVFRARRLSAVDESLLVRPEVATGDSQLQEDDSINLVADKVEFVIEPSAEAADEPLAEEEVEFAETPAPESTDATYHGDYQSLGKVKPFVGDVYKPGVMLAALEARAFHKEVIMFSSDAAHFELTVNAIMDLAELGMEHYLVFMDNSTSCEYARSLVPNIGCIWNSMFVHDHPTAYWHGIRHLWMMRWVTFSRIIQEGYNPLMLDSDISIRRNPYEYIKSDTFSSFNLLVAYEQGWPGINCGTAYAQGAAPDGPTAWIASEVAERTLRWLDDASFLVTKVGSDSSGAMEVALFEQNIFMDAACSAMQRQPLFYHSFRPWDDHKTLFYSRTAWDDAHRPLCGEIEAWDWSEFEIPEAWRCVAGDVEHELIAWHDISIPPADNWAPERVHGGQPFPAAASVFTNRYHDYLQRESAGMYEIPSTIAAAPSRAGSGAQVETMARAPLWLFSRWAKYGRYGQWEDCDECGAHAVLAHTVFAQGQAVEGKAGPFKVLGWWHWDASKLVNNGLLFRSSTTEAPLPKVVAFVPSVRLAFANTDKLWTYLQDSLMKVAALTGRTAVWPYVPCDSAWIERLPARDTLHKHPIVDSSVITTGCGNDLKCAWFGPMTTGCSTVGMSAGDFEHLLSLLPESARAPTQQNTMLHEHMRAPAPAPADVWDIGFADMAEVPETRVLSGESLAIELKAYDEQPVLWVGAPFTVDEMPLESLIAMDDFLYECTPPPVQQTKASRVLEVKTTADKVKEAQGIAEGTKGAEHEAKADMNWVMGDGATVREGLRVAVQTGDVAPRRMVIQTSSYSSIGIGSDSYFNPQGTPPEDTYNDGFTPSGNPAPPADSYNDGFNPSGFGEPPGDSYNDGFTPSGNPEPPADSYNDGFIPSGFGEPPGDSYNDGFIPSGFGEPPGDSYNDGFVPSGFTSPPTDNYNF